ncbi:MAG: hypothetical protein N2201_00200 [candidate division WOR-3 bacterium]|nr:hypothetical protein [candidate division WOR-3 bacterium]
MVSNLRIVKNWYLVIDKNLLNPKIGCGLVLSHIRRYHNISEMLQKALNVYHIRTLFADKPAQALLEDDAIVKEFCKNALSMMPLHSNLQNSFSIQQVFLLIDPSEDTGWLLGAAENRLQFLNYYKDVVPVLMKKFGILLSGSTPRLLPLGWQNLYDVFDEEFIKSHPEIKSIEILSVLTDTRFRYPVLSIGINLLNIKTADAVREKVLEVLKPPCQLK